MKYVGTWAFHSIGVMNDKDEMEYLGAEEYIKSPMPYVDESDEEAVGDEIRERKKLVKMKVKICEDNKLYMLMPIPKEITEEELSAAVASGRFMLIDGMLADKAISWEERDGVLYYDFGFGNDDPCVKGSDEDGYFTFMTTRLIKI